MRAVALSTSVQSSGPKPTSAIAVGAIRHEPWSDGSATGSVFVPLTLPTGESIVKRAWKLVTGPADATKSEPGRTTGRFWGEPTVSSPLSVNVPGYGPNASPETLYEIVELPLALHARVTWTCSVGVSSSPARLGTAAAAEATGTSAATSATTGTAEERRMVASRATSCRAAC